MSPFGVIDWILAKLRPRAGVVAGTSAAVLPATAVTEGRVVMLHTEALALQAKLHAEAQDLMAKAGKISTMVGKALAEGRTSLTEDESKLAALFDSKTVLAEKVKQFLTTL